MLKGPRVALAIAGILLLGLTLDRAIVCWRLDSHIEHVSGTWIALANDLRHGVFYRAPFGPLGYGGTRFFPLLFCLQALGMKLTGGWRVPGYLLSALSVVSLLAAVFYFLRRFEVGRWLALGGVLAVLAGSSVQDSLLTLREDGMAAALNLWAIALCVGPEGPSRRRLYLSVVLFALAFATKPTSVCGAAAIVLFLLLTRGTRAAWPFFLAVLAAFAAVLIAIEWGSAGRAFEAMRLTLATGTGAGSLLQSPLALAEALQGYWAEIILLVLAGGTLLLSPRGALRVPGLLFLCTLVVTLVIFSSEGTAGNHLIELHVAAVLLFVTWAAQAAVSDIGIGVLAVVCIVAGLGLVNEHRDADFVPVRQNLAAVVGTIGSAKLPILSDSPLVPVVAGQQPYVLDAFMLRVIQEKKPGFANPLWDKMRQRQFSAIVLMDDPTSAQGRDTYSTYHFGRPFLEELQANYVAADSGGDYFLYLPRGQR